MAKSVGLSNGKKWKTQSAALAYFKSMLARYGNGDVVDDHQDHDDLLALLERYDMCDQSVQSKIGCGLGHFERRLNRGEAFSTPGFWAVRSDGTETDFSYITAVKGEPKSTAQQYYDACRSAVNRDLSAKKQNQFDRFGDEDGCLTCDITGGRVTYENAQLRHAKPTFGVLVEEFRREKGWQWSEMYRYLTLPQDAQIATTFEDKRNAEAFRTFHHGRAVLHIVSKQSLRGRQRGTETQVKRAVRF